MAAVVRPSPGPGTAVRPQGRGESTAAGKPGNKPAALPRLSSAAVRAFGTNLLSVAVDLDG